MEMTHHQLAWLEEDGHWICGRCGLVNPTDDQPCIPFSIEAAERGSQE